MFAASLMFSQSSERIFIILLPSAFLGATRLKRIGRQKQTTQMPVRIATLTFRANVTKDQSHDGEVGNGEGSGGEVMRVKTGMHKVQQGCNEQAVTKGASNAALDAALCAIAHCGCAAEEVRNNAWENQSNTRSAR